jgi:hypothetical protein
LAACRHARSRGALRLFLGKRLPVFFCTPQANALLQLLAFRSLIITGLAI